MDNNYIIYKAINNITGEIYIGATKSNIHQRKLDHTERANRGEHNKFHNAINTYGPHAFKWEQIDTANTISELAQKEKKFVLQYNSKENGLNSDSGGGFQKPVYQYSIIDESLVNTFDCLESGANAVEAHKNSIAKACSGENRTCKGFYWSYSLTEPFVPPKELKRKVVLQFKLDGNLIAKYESVSEASKNTGVSKTCIAKCCRGERDKSGGFLWKYI